MSKPEVFIVGGARTPMTDYVGALKDVSALEQRVAEAEDWLKRIEEALSSPMPGDDMVKLSQDYERAEKQLESAMSDWEHAITYATGIGAKV